MRIRNSKRLTGVVVAPALLLFCVATLSPATAARAQARREIDRTEESPRSEPVRSVDSSSSNNSSSSSSSSNSSSSSSPSSDSSSSSSNSSNNSSSSSSSSDNTSSIINDSGSGDRTGGSGSRGGGRGDGRGRDDGEGRRRHRENPGGGGAGPGGGGGDGGGRRHGRRGDDDDRRGHGRKHDKDEDRKRRHRSSDYDPTIYDTSDTTYSAQSSDDRDECERGFEEGRRVGAMDALRGQTNNPQRSRHYKRGGGGIISWGRSEAAKQAYRDCFLRGYEEGYQNPGQY